jgi:hypothetical protein
MRLVFETFPGMPATMRYICTVIWRVVCSTVKSECFPLSVRLFNYHTLIPSWLPFARDARGRSFVSIVQKPGGFSLPSWSWIMSAMRSAQRSHLSAALFRWFMIRSYLVATTNKRRDFSRAYVKQPALFQAYVILYPFQYFDVLVDFVCTRFIL